MATPYAAVMSNFGDTRALAHLSDLHIGRSQANDERARGLCRALLEHAVDHVVVTGDLTHRGRTTEWTTFRDIFAPFLRNHRMTLVPGNHDRLGDDVAGEIMPGERVQVETAPGLYLVRVNSTGPHNRSWLHGHGLLTLEDIHAVDAALTKAPAHCMVVLLLHHHPSPLPDDRTVERLSSLMGWRFTSELDAGGLLLDRVRHRCDLVLHGHRHKPAARIVHDDPRPVRMFNAGSSTELAKGCLFTHSNGHMSAPLSWLSISEPTSGPSSRSPARSRGNRPGISGVENELSSLLGHQLAL